MLSKPDKQYWSKELDYPLSPSIDDLTVYKKHLNQGSTLLLGCTHKLLNISDNQLDIDPWYESSTVIIGDWRDNKIYYENIIGDGVFNFTKELTDSVLLMASRYCKNLVVRCFNKKMPVMKIANFFPTSNDFDINPTKVYDFKDYNFYIWNFDHDGI